MNKLRDLIEHAAKSPIPPRLQEEEEEEEEEAKKQRRNLIIIPINQCIITVYALYGACWPTPPGQNWRSRHQSATRVRQIPCAPDSQQVIM